MEVKLNNKIIDIDSVKTKDNLIVKGKSSYYQQSLYTKTFFSEKELTRFCTNVERTIRRSNEYAAYIGHIKSTFDLASCSFFNNITDENATIEMHHYPFSLYDIVETVVVKNIENKKLFSSFTIADEVMKLHFQNKVGLVPLCVTTHQLAHDGDIFINFNQVFGRFDKFVDEYEPYISETLKNTYNLLLEKSKQDLVNEEYNILNYNKQVK